MVFLDLIQGYLSSNVLGIIFNLVGVIKTVPVVMVFYFFSIWALLASPFRMQEQLAYRDAQSKFSSGEDHRGCMQKFGACFFDRYSKENVRQRSWARAQKRREFTVRGST